MVTMRSDGATALVSVKAALIEGVAGCPSVAAGTVADVVDGP